MRLSGKDYEQRLRQFSRSTLVLMSEILNGDSKEAAIKMSDITTNSELTEEQVVAALKRLKWEYMNRS